MEAIFSKMMDGCLKGMSEEDKKKMMACGEKLAALWPCLDMKNLTEEDRKAMREKMMAFCGSKMELISACFRKKGPTSDQACCAEKA